MKFNTHVFMNETSGDNPTGTSAGSTQQEETQPSSNLPSDNKPTEGITSFEIKPEDLQDGKFKGKWSNPQEMADYIKNIEDKHADLNRQISENGKQTDKEIADTAAQLQKQQLQDSTVKELLPEFLKNGMVVTEDMKIALTDTGLTEQDIKIGAYEMKEAIDLNAGYVGGKENYEIIMNHHAENMTDDEKVKFNHSIQDPKNSEAVMLGLQVMYEKSLSNSNNSSENSDRIRGNQIPQTAAIKPYGSKAELMKDKSFADSRNASSGDKAKYRQRLSITPESVYL